MKESKNGFANFTSYLLHPIWIPCIGTYFIAKIYEAQMPESVFELLFKITLLFSLILPLFSSILLKLTGVISSLKMPKASERRIPLFLSFTFFIIMAHLFNAIHMIPFDFALMAFGGSLSIFVALFLLPVTKISIHTLSIGSLWGALFSISQNYQVDLFSPLILVSMLAGIIGTCRLILNAHSERQVYIGFMVGVLFQICSFLFQHQIFNLLNFNWNILSASF